MGEKDGLLMKASEAFQFMQKLYETFKASFQGIFFGDRSTEGKLGGLLKQFNKLQNGLSGAGKNPHSGITPTASFSNLTQRARKFFRRKSSHQQAPEYTNLKPEKPKDSSHSSGVWAHRDSTQWSPEIFGNNPTPKNLEKGLTALQGLGRGVDQKQLSKLINDTGTQPKAFRLQGGVWAHSNPPQAGRTHGS